MRQVAFACGVCATGLAAASVKTRLLRVWAERRALGSHREATIYAPLPSAMAAARFSGWLRSVSRVNE